MASQWQRQVVECSLMCLALQSPPSSKPFAGKTGLVDNLTWVAEENCSMNNRKEICNMVMANNAITLKQIRDAILHIFQNINTISISTIDRVLKEHQMTMKQIYRVPFERNSDRVKELRYQYVNRIMALEGHETPHILVFVDEAGFNLAKGRKRGRNIIGHRATVDVPGQRGGNITMCAAISETGVATHIPSLGPYNTHKLLIFLDRLYTDFIPENERGLIGPHLPIYVIVWDNVNFHHSPLIRGWFATHPRMVMGFLPPYSPFLNPIEEFFSAWRWRVYEHHAQDQPSLLHAMDAACDDITGDQCRGWLRHARRFFPRCIARESIRCDVDENLWPDGQQRVNNQEGEDSGQERENEYSDH
ncbi:potassium voltage-gated channel Shaker-related subfamily A, beta member 1 [Sarotherodon galilaeus]